VAQHVRVSLPAEDGRCAAAASANERRNTSAVARALEPSVLAFGGKQRGAGSGVVEVELPPTSSMNQRKLRSAPLISGTSLGLFGLTLAVPGVDGGLVTGDHQHPRHRGELVFGQLVCAVASLTAP
jgi:hypothetical protein